MNTTVVTLQLPASLYDELQVTSDKLKNLQKDVSGRKRLLNQIVNTFEARYERSLSELELKLENLKIEEHPAWEDSIEWRNALEQLDSIQLSENIFEWLQNLVTQSTVS